jgi:hypothetical protein
MARKAQVPAVTAGQSRYILEKLIDEGKVSAADVRRHLASIWDEMNAIERRMSELRGLAEPLKHPVRAARKAAKQIKKATRKLSAKTRASYQLQGQYLGYMRQISERDRGKYKKMAKEEGREKAVAAMKKALGK